MNVDDILFAIFLLSLFAMPVLAVAALAWWSADLGRWLAVAATTSIASLVVLRLYQKLGESR